MKKLLIVVTILAGLTFYSCKKEKIESDIQSVKEIVLSETDKKVLKADNQFGIDLFKNIVTEEESGKNLMISPTSVALALAMTYNGAAGDTKVAMEEALRLQGLSTDEINKSYKYLIEALENADEKVLLEIANSIWYKKEFSVENDFITVNQNYYNAEVTDLDFADPSSIDIINNWVAQNTNNKIEEIIKEIDPNTVMFLINAIYFKGIWKYQFVKSETTDQNFMLSDGSEKQVPTMFLESDLNCFQNELFQAVELPYGRGNYSMYLFVPQNSKTTNDIISELNETKWNSWMSEFTEANEMSIYLSKFTFEFEKELKDILSLMGIEIAFSPTDADFSNINPERQLFISKVIHKTFIELNEEGTEAAAVTAVVINEVSAVSNEIRYNKPFVFAIRENTTGAILFIGKVEDPS